MSASEVSDTLVAPGEVSENAAPSRIGQGGESATQCLALIFNHLVKYLSCLTRERKQIIQSRCPIASAAATIGHAEITSNAPKTSASIANSK